MKHSIAMLAFAGVVACATAAAGQCGSANTVAGTTSVAVLVTASPAVSSTGTHYNDYGFSLGTFNEFDTICIVGSTATTLVFDLSGNSDDYVLEDIRMSFPSGFNTADSPFRTVTIGKRSAVVHFKGSAATVDERFGYDLILRNTRTGERLILDPVIKNVPA